MGVGLSLLMLAAGAIINLAVEVDNTRGVNWDTIGIILMVVGGIGVLVSLIFWSSWGGPGGRRETIIEEH